MEDFLPKKIGTSRKSAAQNTEKKRAEVLLGRELPNNIDAEQGLLASMIIDKSREVLNVCIESKLNENYFYAAAHRKIYKALVELHNESKPIDEIVLTDKLESMGELENVGGIQKINEIAGRIETYAHFKQWLKIVREKYFLRTLILTCYETIENANSNTDSLDVFLEKVEGKILGISQDRISDSAQKVSEKIDSAMSMVKKIIESRGDIMGVPTGFTELDKLTRGLHGGEMIVVAGRPGTGKTSIALNIAENAVFNKRAPVPTLVFSLEMSTEQLLMRMLCSRGNINQFLLRNGRVQNIQVNDIVSAGKELRDAPLWIDDSADINILEIRAKARRLKQQHNIGLIVLDYLQLLKPIDSRIPREQQIAEMSRGMKAMAKELDVPVIVLAQLNRSTEKENRDPRASDLRESGAIEQDADVILLLNWLTSKEASKQDVDGTVASNNSNKLVKLIIAKQRSGPTGEITLLFNRDITKYQNYQKHDDVY